MLTQAITRRLFVVLLADNDHGKTTMILSLVRQGQRHEIDQVRRGARTLYSPWGRVVDALIIPRSYQETLAGEFRTVENALSGVDPLWRERDLVVFPSHIEPVDCDTMIRLAHGAGFDAVAVAVILQAAELPRYANCLQLPWDERWTLSNNEAENPVPQMRALGHDLWGWIAASLERR